MLLPRGFLAVRVGGYDNALDGNRLVDSRLVEETKMTEPSKLWILVCLLTSAMFFAFTNEFYGNFKRQLLTAQALQAQVLEQSRAITQEVRQSTEIKSFILGEIERIRKIEEDQDVVLDKITLLIMTPEELQIDRLRQEIKELRKK